LAPSARVAWQFRHSIDSPPVVQCASLKCSYATERKSCRGLLSFRWHFAEMPSILVPGSSLPVMPMPSPSAPGSAGAHDGGDCPTMHRYFFR
jgi:hypothetical protein